MQPQMNADMLCLIWVSVFVGVPFDKLRTGIGGQ